MKNKMLKNLNKIIKIKEKKGGERLISFYWFLILIIVTGAVIAAVMIYYGSFYDVRNMETQILSYKIAECLSQGGELIAIDLTNCNLNENIGANGEYYAKINFYDLETGNRINNGELKEIKIGNIELQSDCNKQQVNQGNWYERQRKNIQPTLAQCGIRNFYVYDSENNQKLNIEILTAVKKLKQNVN